MNGQIWFGRFHVGTEWEVLGVLVGTEEQQVSEQRHKHLCGAPASEELVQAHEQAGYQAGLQTA